MNRTSQRSTRHFILSLFLMVLMYSIQGCGVVGPPLAPEDIGIEAKVRSQKEAEEKTGEKKKKEEQPIVPLGQEDVTLPPVNPLGVQ